MLAADLPAIIPVLPLWWLTGLARDCEHGINDVVIGPFCGELRFTWLASAVLVTTASLVAIQDVRAPVRGNPDIAGAGVISRGADPARIAAWPLAAVNLVRERRRVVSLRG